MENREIAPQDWPSDWPNREQSGELGNIVAYARSGNAMLCHYENPVKKDIYLGFVYNKKNGKEGRSQILSIGSLLAHNPYWDKIDEQPPQEELRRWAALPQVKDIYSVK